MLVGGLAVNYYGYSRTTGDVDLWLEDTAENRHNLVDALAAFGIEGAEVFLTYPLIAGYAEVLLNNGIYLDMMSDMVVLKQAQFNDCYEKAEQHELSEGVFVKVVHINQLIEEKSASFRAKDIEDAEQLRRLKEMRS